MENPILTCPELIHIDTCLHQTVIVIDEGSHIKLVLWDEAVGLPLKGSNILENMLERFRRFILVSLLFD